MISGYSKKLLRTLDAMLDDALSGDFSAQSYDESLLSKIESKMVRFLEQARIRHAHTEGERARVRSLISDISHQTKTPLANITLHAGLLVEQNLTEDQAVLATQIMASTEKLNFLIQSLVKASRLESGMVKLEPKPGNVCDLIESAIAECDTLAAGKKIKLSFAPVKAPVTALFDLRWCTEALFNILENAVKYTPENGRVAVSATEYEMFARVDIADTGRGIR